VPQTQKRCVPATLLPNIPSWILLMRTEDLSAEIESPQDLELPEEAGDEQAPPPPPRGRRGGKLLAWLWESLGLGLALVLIFAVLSPLLQAIGGKVEAARERDAASQGRHVRPATNVVVTVIEPVTVRDTIRLPGIVRPFREVTVSARVTGTVLRTRSTPVEEGEKIQTGAEILRLDTRDHQIALDRAETALKAADTALERTRGLMQSRARSQADLDADAVARELARINREAALLDMERCVLRSPVDGIVEKVIPEAGELISANDPVATILDIDKVRIEIGVPEKDIAALSSLTAAELSVAALGGKRFAGRKTFLSHRPMDQTLVYLLRLEADNPGHELRPGMFVEAELVRGVRNSVVVPLFAVIARGDEHEVFVVREAEPGAGEAPDGAAGAPIAFRRPVRLGLIQGRHVEVISGLEPGERLIVLGQRSVEHGSPVSVTRTVRDLEELLR
jgi:membrane fusion protein, multidrug efflux system